MNSINKNLIKSLIFMMMLIHSASANTLNDTTMSNESDNISITYRTDVDQDYGFYRVRDITTHKPALYDIKNNTLTINVGDTVIWMNDATPDWPLTIASEQGLWDNTSARLRWNYQKFSYTFNESGEYGVYIKEYPSEKQKIIVTSTEKHINTVTIPPTYIVIEDKDKDKDKYEDKDINTSVPTTFPISTPTPAETSRVIPGFNITLGIIILIIMVTIMIYSQ